MKKTAISIVAQFSLPDTWTPPDRRRDIQRVARAQRRHPAGPLGDQELSGVRVTRLTQQSEEPLYTKSPIKWTVDQHVRFSDWLAAALPPRVACLSTHTTHPSLIPVTPAKAPGLHRQG